VLCPASWRGEGAGRGWGVGGDALQVKALPCASALFPFGLPQKQDD
jgi:hypothetical protein